MWASIGVGEGRGRELLAGDIAWDLLVADCCPRWVIKRGTYDQPKEIFKVTGYVNPDGKFLIHGVRPQPCLPGKLFRYTMKQALYVTYGGEKVCQWMALQGVPTEGTVPPRVDFWKCSAFPEELKNKIETAGFGAEARRAHEPHWVSDDIWAYGDGQWF